MGAAPLRKVANDDFCDLTAESSIVCDPVGDPTAESSNMCDPVGVPAESCSEPGTARPAESCSEPGTVRKSAVYQVLGPMYPEVSRPTYPLNVTNLLSFQVSSHHQRVEPLS